VVVTLISQETLQSQ